MGSSSTVMPSAAEVSAAVPSVEESEACTASGVKEAGTAMVAVMRTLAAVTRIVTRAAEARDVVSSLEQPYREPPAAGHPRHAVVQVPPPTEGGAVGREHHRVARGGEGELERARGGAEQAARRVEPGRPLRRVEHVELAAPEVLRRESSQSGRQAATDSQSVCLSVSR